jgi:hypothetical protein
MVIWAVLNGVPWWQYFSRCRMKPNCCLCTCKELEQCRPIVQSTYQHLDFYWALCRSIYKINWFSNCCRIFSNINPHSHLIVCKISVCASVRSFKSTSIRWRTDFVRISVDESKCVSAKMNADIIFRKLINSNNAFISVLFIGKGKLRNLFSHIFLQNIKLQLDRHLAILKSAGTNKKMFKFSYRLSN